MKKPLTSTKDKEKKREEYKKAFNAKFGEDLMIQIGALSMTAFGMETGFQMFKQLEKSKSLKMITKTEC